MRAAAGYLVDALEHVGPGDLGAATPCPEWTVGDLLAHLDDATGALLEAAGGVIALAPRFVGETLARARLLAEGHPPAGSVHVGDVPIDQDLVHTAGSLELAVHGWDLNTALHRAQPIPETLARQLLSACAALTFERPEFGPAVTPPLPATAAERLLSSVGRNCHVELAP